ncbi:MAG: nucleotidyltransferase family protein [Candidatus Omnitrophota bacterium]|jgi:hypothetical protein
MNPEAQLLLFTAKDVVYGGYRPRITNTLSSKTINWIRLKDLLFYHELDVFFYSVAQSQKHLLPAEYYSSLKTTYYGKMMYHMIHAKEISGIARMAQKENITLAPLKGFSYPQDYYKPYGFRPAQDIDLLVQKNELEKAIVLLESLGYSRHFQGSENYWRRQHCHLGFKKSLGGSHAIVELHWSVDIERDGRQILSSLWHRLKTNCIDGQTSPVLSPEDNLFCIALHQRRFGKMLSLKYVCDAGLILEREKLDWDYILRTACREKARASLFFLLAHIQVILGKDLKDKLNSLRIPLWQRKAIFHIIKFYGLRNPKSFNVSYLYALCHFILYDSIRYPIDYALNIPEEQFAKFYGLPLYSPRTKRRYKLRFLYALFKLLQGTINKLFSPAHSPGK